MHSFLLARRIRLPDFAWTRELGWAAAVLAVITAYVRALGASMGAGQQFIGPMAKQQRMALMTATCLIGAFAPFWPSLARIIPLALALVVIGCVVTIFRRCCRIAREMESKKLMKSLFAAIAKLISGANARWIGCVPDVRQRVYFANHTSNLDALVIWASLPPHVRDLTRPVAARDYWIKSKLRLYLANKIFNAVLIERKKPTAHDNPLTDMLNALGERHSLIIFPEGGRQTGAEMAPFKGGLVSSRQRPAGCGICSGAD